MSIIKNKDIYDPSQGDPLKPLYDMLTKLDTKIEATKGKMNTLEKAVKDVNRTGSGAEAKALIDNTQKLQIETGKLNNLQGARSKIDQALKVNQEILNRQTKENIILKSKVAGAYQRESTQLNQLRRQYKDLAVQEKGATKEGQSLLRQITALDKKLKQVDGSVGQFQRNVGNYKSALQGLGATIKNFFLAGGIMMAIRKVTMLLSDSRELAGQLAGVKVAFDKIATPGLLDELRNQTKGTVSDLELMKQAVKASEFNIPIEKMGSMMQFAAVQAQKMGLSVDYMAESITTGLARGSVMILDNLGISAKELREEMVKTGDLTEAAFNVINKKLAESGGLIETSEIVTARWAARWENIKATAGGFLDNVLVAISPVLEDIWDWLKRLWQNSTKFILDTYNGFVDLYNESRLFRQLIESISVTFTVLWETVKLFFKLFTGQLKLIGKTLAYTFDPRNWGKDFKKGLAEILANQGEQLVGNFKSYGERIGESLYDGINNVIDGKMRKLTPEDFVFTSTKKTKTETDTGGGGLISTAVNKEIEGIKAVDTLKAEVSLAQTDRLKKQLATESEMRAQAMQEEAEHIEKRNELLQESLEMAGAAFGELLGSGEMSYKEFGKFILKTALDIAEKMLLLSMAEIFAKQIASKGFAGIATAAILTGLVKGVFAGIKSQVQNFADGTEYVNGPGTERSDSIPARLSKGERIVPASINKQLMGIPNAKLPLMLNAGYQSIKMESLLNQIDMNTRVLQHGRNDWLDNGYKYSQEWRNGIIRRRPLND